LTAVAFDTALGFERRLRAIPRQPRTVEPDRHLGSESELSNGKVELWEMHSELALVCPNVRKSSLERLSERDPDAFLNKPRAPISPASTSADAAPDSASLPLAVLGYTLWRLADTARTAFLALATVVVLALLAQLLH
jgi:hypothetical protein